MLFTAVPLDEFGLTSLTIGQILFPWRTQEEYFPVAQASGSTDLVLSVLYLGYISI
jgi:hypothetical protein